MNSKQQQIVKTLWYRGNLSFLHHKGQQLIHSQIQQLPKSVREIVILCSRRYGKSYYGVTLALITALSKPNSKIAILAPSKGHTKDIVVPLVKMITCDAPKGLIKHKKSELRWECHNGSQIILAAFETAIEACRGQAFDLILLEESGLSKVDEYNYILKSVLMPTLAHSQGKIIHLTTPSFIINHPLHTETIPKAEENGALFKYTINDNPTLSDEQKEELIREMGGIDSIDVRRELFCEIVRDETTLAVPSFDIKSVQEIEIKHHIDRPWLLSIDFGGVRDRHGAVLCTLHENKTVVVDSLLLDPGTPTSTLIKEFRDLLAKHNVNESSCYIYADAQGQLLTDLQQEYNFHATLPNKSDWASSLRLLDSAFKNSNIIIKKGQDILIKTLNSGQLNKNRNDFARTNELGHLDLCAALMYANRMSFMMNNDWNTESNIRHYEQQPEKYWVKPQYRSQNNNQKLADALLKPMSN